jgi:hypothetical protein
MEETCPSDTSVLTRPTRRHSPEDGILDSHRCENLISYFAVVFKFYLANKCPEGCNLLHTDMNSGKGF